MLKNYFISFMKVKHLKSIAQVFVVMLFLFFGNQMVSQIIIESGTAQVDFGTDADVQAGITEYIYDLNGVLQPDDAHPESDDWFENGNTGGSPARGVIDITGPGPSGVRS